MGQRRPEYRGPVRLRAKQSQEERRAYQTVYIRAYNARKKLKQELGYDRPFADYSQEKSDWWASDVQEGG